MSYKPLDRYGIIGNLHTAALVGDDGSIDWLCWPNFDSPSIFAALVDHNKGGRFSISPCDSEITRKQVYWPETNVLLTRFLSADGIAELTDFMPLGLPEHSPDGRVVRSISVSHGTVKFRLECLPAFNYARDQHQVRLTASGVCFHGPGLSLSLTSRIPLQMERNAAVAEFTLSEGQSASFVLAAAQGEDCPAALAEAQTEALFRATVDYWHRWLSRCTYTGRWRELVQRSALVLKLMTYAPTGAIVAAPTSSLPEAIGGERNWDYRYTWIRDAAFTLYALLRIGFTQEAAAFMRWLEARCHELEPDGSLQIMYGIDGRHRLDEETLGHLEGYRGSRPVRVGNSAYEHLQLDIYGELMDAVYLYNKYGSPISYDLWVDLRRLVDWVCDNWHRQDRGIWEVRGEQRHFVYSKLMCWVALDRGLRLADKRSFPADLDRWLRARNAIYEEVMEKGWSAKRRAFTQSYGSEALDASSLVMPLVFFTSPSDPRMLSTLDAILDSPKRGGLVSGSLVYRYLPQEASDGLAGEEGTFNICTFWLVEAMTRAGVVEPERLARARLMFEKKLGFANHLGLYSEETGIHGEALGNFPQAFTHLALISAAFNLDRALKRK